MLLRRVIEHVRVQNWTAVGIDFFIVVIGVFVGMQVANWNEARRDRESEHDYLDRLRLELAEVVPQAQSTRASLAERMGRIEALRAFLATGNGGDALDDSHCEAAGRSHIYAATIFYPPTIKELISTGRILLIRDAAIRTAIMSFDQAYANMTQLRTDIQIDRLVLARHYPRLIDSGLSLAWDQGHCDFEGMRKDQAFLNDFTDNLRRYAGYTAQLGDRQAETLASLAQALAGERRGLPLPAPGKNAEAMPTHTPGGD